MGHNLVEKNVDEGLVYKHHHSPISFHREQKFYEILQGAGLIPCLISAREDTLILEYVAGETLSRRPPNVGDFSRLGQWYLRMEEVFFQKTGEYCCLEDGNFRNFLVTEEKLVGIDFECWHTGTLAQGLAIPLAHIHTMDCGEGERQAIIDCVYPLFLQGGVDKTELDCAVRAEISALLRWRSVRPLMKKTSAAILMGGGGKRLGGVKKYHLRYENYTYLEHITNQLSIFDRLYYSVGQGELEILAWGRAVVDEFPQGGPAVGFSTLLRHCKTEYLLLWPCDTPLLTRKFLVELLAQFDPSYDGIVPVAQGRRYPLCALYSTEIFPKIHEMVSQGVRKMGQLLDGLNIQYLQLDGLPQELYNVNTREDLCFIETQSPLASPK